ncbi:PREDICTED: RING finger protein 207-like isoform X2 [Branchiostoma belcheri]|uniref:RING finger protein 207-like isoform X2 n=1 Tax=Branchiostoma belcheri TaxID=7741 RepID=A0A6P4ZKC2_BRABE|nr:PREDICTED: RING finger protein 207-like isoform X2 [Branchiostoma belcheri]
MATAAFPDEVSGDSLECSICCYTFKNPKVLPCLHTFCEHCLREWVQKNDGDTFPCPICRQPVPLPQDGVEGLKDNVFLASLVKAVTEHQNIRQGKDDLLCTSCDEGKPATSRCSECAEFLCESCESAHRLVRATKGHTLFTFEELKTGKYDKVFRARTAPPCSKHSGEILKLYCRTCETPICNECALFEHRDSQHDFARLEEVAVEKRETILDLTPQCQDRMQFFRQTEEVQKRLKEQLQLNAEWARQNINKTVQTITALVKEEGERLLTCVDTEEKSRNKQIDAEIEAAQISLASAKSTCDFAETLAREGGDYEVVSFSQDMTTRLSDLTKPPADTVDFELANINVDYSVMEHKLTTNSPKFARYTLPKPTERKLSSLLKRVPQCRTDSRTGLRPGASGPSVSGNVSRKIHASVLSDDDSNDDLKKDKQNKPEHKGPSAEDGASSSGLEQEQNSPFEVFVDPDILIYIRHKHHAEIRDIGKRYKSLFHTSKDNTQACFSPSPSLGKDPEPEKAIDEFTTLYQQVFSKITCENFNIIQYSLAPTFLLEGVRKMRHLHPEVLTKITDDDTTVMFIGEPEKIRAARVNFCSLLGIPVSRGSRGEGNNIKATATKSRKSGQPNAGKNDDSTCPICLSVPTMPTSLPCKDQGCEAVFCKKCLDKAMKKKSCCPVCSAVVGKLTGNQPKGRMTIAYNKKMKLEGYKLSGAIIIDYVFRDGIQGVAGASQPRQALHRKNSQSVPSI